MANSTHNKMYSESTYRVGGNTKVSQMNGKIYAEISAIGLKRKIKVSVDDDAVISLIIENLLLARKKVFHHTRSCRFIAYSNSRSPVFFDTRYQYHY